MVRWLALLCALAFVACVPWWDVSDTYDPQFPEVLPIGATTPLDIGVWLSHNIRYTGDDIHDKTEYWQSPDQTYRWRCGDCEDYAILMLYMLHTELGGWPALAVGRYDDSGHGWVLWEGRQYEPQTGRDVTEDPHYTLRETVPYGVALWRSMNTHRTLDE